MKKLASRFHEFQTVRLRVKALIIKEILAVLRDKKSRFMLILPPLVQLIILSHAATLDVMNISLAVYNQDSGWYSHELVQRIKGSPYFLHVYEYKNPQEAKRAIDTQKVIVSLNFQSNFSRLVAGGQSAPLQVVLDGRKSNASQIVLGYLTLILQEFNVDILHYQGVEIARPIDIEFRSFFNPNIDYIYFTVPTLVAILSMMLALTLTSLSVSRERENGTFDQLLVSPLQPWQILIGKMMPAMLISIVESTLLMILAVLLFSVPFKGSLVLLYLSMIVFLFSIVGIGLFISSVSHTQQQSILGSFVFITPVMLLSGYATPIENMPTWLQPFTNLLPLKHFFIIIKGIFLKNMPATEVWLHTWPMALIALFTLSVAGWMFKRRLE
ncbi:MAG: ABC transporter permease [Alphaproteobacteria bacterium]|nr:ABC transporter permease [Alphaproteobacteria bacterium]MBP7729218.1 ABC transporter permease [Alphaproteobacteria bacterium]